MALWLPLYKQSFNNLIPYFIVRENDSFGMIQKEGLRKEDILTKQTDEVMGAKEQDEVVQREQLEQSKEDDTTYQIKGTSLLVYAVSLFISLDI